MICKRLRLTDFRHCESAELSFGEGINVLSGPNGAGKTNWLEAIFFLSCARSIRGARERELIRFGQDSARLESDFVSGGRVQTLDITLSTTARRSMLRNGVALPAPRHLMGLLPAVFFQPEDLALLRGGAGVRRRFMDMTLCQLRPRYLDALSSYRRLHEAKLKALRLAAHTPSYTELLPEYNRSLADTGAVIAGMRGEFVLLLAERAAAHHYSISGGRERLRLRFQSHALDAESCLAQMNRRAEAERLRFQLLVGAHKDEIVAELDGRPIRLYGSQGQTRTAAIAMKLAQRDVMRESFGEPPLLLLDDVLSELDSERQGYILHHIEDGQTFLSACEPGRLTSTGENFQVSVSRER